MNTVEPVRVALTIAMATILAFAGLHVAVTASNWFVGYVVLPLLKEQESLRSYMLWGGHVAFVAASVAVGVALAYASASQVWLGTFVFVAAVALFVIDWEQKGGSYFWALLDVPVIVFVATSLSSAYVVRRVRRTHAA